MKKGKLKSFLLWALPPLAGGLMRLWFTTCRVREHGTEHLIDFEGENAKPAIAVFWHYSIFFVLFFLRKYEATAMVSASGDGDYFARLVESFGCRTVRGSKNQKGVQALKGLLKAAQKGETCALVADGSQGPPLVMQPGALLLASRTGLPVVPVVWSASRYFTLRSWDRMVLPKPFSRVELYYGEPLVVPAGVKGEELEEYRVRVERELLALYRVAWGAFNKSKHSEN